MGEIHRSAAQRYGVGRRLLGVALAFVATAPIWPMYQSGGRFNEALAPAGVLVLFGVVLVFPAAWALLALSRRVGARVALLLGALTGGWSLWTVNLGSFGTPPTVDDGLRWYLIAAGIVVVVGVLIDVLVPGRVWSPQRLRWVLGALVLGCGAGLIAAVPDLDGEPMPPAEVLLPLPLTVVVLEDRGSCSSPGRSCARRFTLAGTDNAPGSELVRRVGEHLVRDKGWRVQWYDADPAGSLVCRRTGWLVNPYVLCGSLRVDEQGSTVVVQFGHSNQFDPVW